MESRQGEKGKERRRGISVLLVGLWESHSQIIGDDLVADVNALVADVGRPPSYQFRNLTLRSSTKRAAQSLVRPHLLAEIDKEFSWFCLQTLPTLPVSV